MVEIILEHKFVKEFQPTHLASVVVCRTGHRLKDLQQQLVSKLNKKLFLILVELRDSDKYCILGSKKLFF